MTAERWRGVAQIVKWTVFCAVIAGVSSCSGKQASVPNDDAARAALESIATAAGISVSERMVACNLLIDWSESWLAVVPTDSDEADFKAGDRLLYISFSAPNPPGKAHGRTAGTMRWRIRGGEVMPRNAWATSIQQQPRPIGSKYFLNC